jgi:hypothetical protein
MHIIQMIYYHYPLTEKDRLIRTNHSPTESIKAVRLPCQSVRVGTSSYTPPKAQQTRQLVRNYGTDLGLRKTI